MEGDAEQDRADLNLDLDWFRSKMIAKGLDLGDLGIAGLTNKTDFSKLTDEEIVRMTGEISNLAAN
jgi:hypothetical protein